ncbi:CBS domain-containing protein [Methanoculleus sp. FWC-SCC1]|uniref:CBS domain-containing protein n=1 Tax=Methanoculleus frigidifontis TaxID=2584085 RepID=A0ABT8M9Y9_9EURY|nr:CBS domain-containing protein [Methanoculleus sp. FWC-SCC1]MDN7024761.1 CBS domain-containing protein [Methanoculleus sp. FWC-SCC1]
MQVQDVMTKNPVVVPVEAPVREAARLLRTYRIGGLPVMRGDELVGIITESDVLSLLDTGEISDDLWLPSPLEIIEVPIREFINWERTKQALSDIGDMPIGEVMSSPAITIDAEADIEAAAALMLREGVARLPVVREGELVGIVTRADIVHGVGAGAEESA